MILIAEDEPLIAKGLSSLLSALGETVVVPSIERFRGMFERDQTVPDLAVIDLGMPDGSFLTVLSDPKWNQRLTKWPIIFVSMADDIATIERLISSGFHDFMAKPLNENVLYAKSRNLIEKVRGQRQSGPTLCLQSFRVTLGERTSAPLTALECKLFSSLRTAGEQGIDRQTLAKSVWEESVPRNKIDVTITRLRKKLGELSLSVELNTNGKFVLKHVD
jgi:DNA-binding response OmpR family regulator